jgi:hypothetical protein
MTRVVVVLVLGDVVGFRGVLIYISHEAARIT